MIRYLAVRIASGAGTLLAVTIVIFLGVHAVPGGPAVVLGAHQAANPEVIAAIRHRFGLDQPLPEQYWKWLVQAVQGNFGRSITTGQPVSEMIARRIPVTLEIAIAALLIAIVLGGSLGVLAAVRHNKMADHLSNTFAIVILSIPNFWVGILLIAFVAVRLGALPASGWVSFSDDPIGNLQHLVMPAVVLGTALIAIIMRQTRSSMIDTMSMDFIRTAYAKGIHRRRVIFKHGVRNSLTTVITVVGLQLGVLIAGSGVTEQVFLIPGFGRLMVTAANTLDYPVLQAVTLITAVAYVLINLIVDILYSVLNPRVRLGGSV